MSSRSRTELEAAAIDTIRGWQTDQDIFDEAAATYAGINRTDFRCLDILDRGGRMTAGQLATAARLTSGAVTAVLDHLEKAGFARRVRDPADRRRVLIEVMPDLLAQSMPIYGPIIKEGARTMATYTDEQLETILDFMLRGRDLLARNTTRVLALIEERDRTNAGRAG
jgi:DNA-binding MarR family transcriptional regulator